jgi:hypothetical protein
VGIFGWALVRKSLGEGRKFDIKLVKSSGKLSKTDNENCRKIHRNDRAND